jgi:hypothetical protein
VAKDRLNFHFSRRIATELGWGGLGNRFGHRACLIRNVRYAIHFTDGVRTECFSSDGALRLIAYRHRVAPAALVTDKTEDRILVWLYPNENTIAEVIISA